MKQFRAWREQCPANAAVSELVADACAGLAGPCVGLPRYGPSLSHICGSRVAGVAEIYRLNDERLKHHDPGHKRQTPAFDAAQTVLKGALDVLFAQAGRELATLPDTARQAKVLRSLANHRHGRCVFGDRPLVPLDNNFAERILRGPAIGRLLSHGSDSVKGAEFTATLYSVVGTLSRGSRRPACVAEPPSAHRLLSSRSPIPELSGFPTIHTILVDLLTTVSRQIPHNHRRQAPLARSAD